MLKIDLHVHTVASGHAFSTIDEITRYASKKGIKVVGIADHGPSLNSTLAHFIYFKVLPRDVPEKINGVRVLKGVEANIVNADGKLDLDDGILKRLDYVMIGLHLGSLYKGGSEMQNTSAVINAMKNRHVKFIAHPYYDDDFEVDIEKIAKEACRKNILLEVNTSKFKKEKFQNSKRYVENLKKMIAVVKSENKKVILNSDAHSAWHVGDDSGLARYKKMIGLTDTLIINNYPKELEKFLGVRF